MDDLLLYVVADRVARITLNRPEKRNALNLGIRRQLVDALREAERDDDVAVVLLDAAGPSFSAGYDLSDPKTDTPPGWVDSVHFNSWSDQFGRSVFRDWMVIWDLMKPVVAKVQGYCLAGGAELMSMCDIVFVADDAVIGYPAMRAQSTPDAPFFPWKLSMAQAKYLQLTGNSVSGKEAAELGWVAKSFPADELDDQVQRLLRPLSQVDPALLAANKASLNQAYEQMGMRAHLGGAWQLHGLSARYRERSGEFKEISGRDGVKAATEWRDGAFRREGFTP
ncbi:enoyl-CoA hydratase [Frankia sp. R43]|uniref:enoyl-CoA hydratase-related protein n=1 Tax=Frankia sp. R43 TaxID=269536 RepID=UPI0006C9E73B|nr:enoyl-CoA hydratase-related protein [Frankia sp. R43]KPM51938.1 enoyl-CoA hydratase [Frankia sp. R43]